jgi:hypothetical protein
MTSKERRANVDEIVWQGKCEGGEDIDERAV